MLEHGGNLLQAIERYGRPRAQWLDLSTGINPHPYPVPPIAADAWHRLPEPDPQLLDAAQRYYDAPRVLAVAGTQAAIAALPRLRATSRVVVAAPAYAEHAHGWARAGHTVREVAHADLPAALPHCDVMVVCNPNNPTGATVAPEQLLQWAGQLAARGGWLVVDEAFGDTVPGLSVAASTQRAGLVVLRSVGKFFGLAGIRLGFVAAHEALLLQLADALGPWTVSGPAQQIGRAALADRAWQAAMRQRLGHGNARMRALLQRCDVQAGGTALFHWWAEPQAADFAAQLAQQGIWIRLFSAGAGGVRIGLPPDEDGWQRLERALDEWMRVKGQR